VIIGKTTNWPGRETDPAFALPPSRDFDGGLIRRWSSTLTRADALALMRLRRPLAQWQRWAFGALFLGWGALVALLPETVVGQWGSLRFVMVLAGGAVTGALALLVLRGLWRRWRAGKMVPQPRAAQFEEWINCIAATRIDGTDEEYLSPELIGEVLLTRPHIFVRIHGTTLVIPTRALPDPAAIAAQLRDLASGPYYFDARD